MSLWDKIVDPILNPFVEEDASYGGVSTGPIGKLYNTSTNEFVGLDHPIYSSDKYPLSYDYERKVFVGPDNELYKRGIDPNDPNELRNSDPRIYHHRKILEGKNKHIMLEQMKNGTIFPQDLPKDVWQKIIDGKL